LILAIFPCVLCTGDVTSKPVVPIKLDLVELFGKIFGGLCIFMYGTKLISQALQANAGDSMKEILGTVSGNQFFGFITGIIVASVLQSSALVSVMVVNFVSSGYMSYYQSIRVLLGAGIGTTITSQIVAFNISKYTLYILAVGFCLLSFSKNKKWQQSGSGLFGLGLTFHGISTMSQSLVPLRTHQPFLNMLVSFSNPILAIVISSIFTALIQSSTAAVGVIQVLGSQHVITLQAGVSLVLGANIGTAVTPILASVGGSRDAARVAFVNIMLKIIAVVVILPLLRLFLVVIESTSQDLARQIANAHTLFNVGSALIFFPIAKQIAFVGKWIIPEARSELPNGISGQQ